MGHVWLARDEQSGLDVALKMVAREGKAAARAEREAKAASALRHPRCQRIYALARDSGHVYIAYEYVPGRTLREALNTGEIGDRQAVEVAAQLLDALAHAHGRGIVHRDVKPSNVLLAENGGAVDVRLLDFGLAQMAEFDTLTARGDVPGTLAYVSPERLHGHEATEAADVWAVGVMLWEALARRHPFRAATMTETSAQIQAGVEPLEHVRPDLPATVHDAVAGALALDPARRPSAEELAAELRAQPGKRRLRKPRRPRPKAPRAPASELAANALRERAVPAGLAAITAGWVSSTLPFFPAGWPLGLTAAAGILAAASPRAGLAFALATAVLPLGNISLGLAIVFAALACGWLALTWRDARYGLLFAAGPLLAPLGLLGLMPLVAQLARGPARRAAHAAAAVLVAALVAGIHHEDLPFDGSAPPELGLAGETSAGAVAATLRDALTAHPALLPEAAVFAAAAIALAHCRRRGAWRAVGFGAGFLAATVLAAPSAPVLPFVAAAWILATGLALEPWARDRIAPGDRLVRRRGEYTEPSG
jgi:serine/threonine-protein kinase